MKNMIQFPNFTLQELLESDTARRKGIANYPSFEVVENLAELCRNFLQPLRDAWGSGIHVNSGYRCPELNKAVGGVETSVHMKGWAADLVPSNGRFEDFVKFVLAWVADRRCPFDQLIIESQGGSRWLHVGLRDNYGHQRHQIKVIDM